MPPPQAAGVAAQGPQAFEAEYSQYAEDHAGSDSDSEPDSAAGGDESPPAAAAAACQGAHVHAAAHTGTGSRAGSE